MIALTLPNSQRGLGSIRLHAPAKELTRSEAKLALANRINRLIRKEEPARAAALLRAYEAEEGLELEPATAGEVLAENSDRLSQAMGQDWPVTATEHDPATEARLEEETLEEFLATLYPVER
jgi:hypothetical protein